MARLSDPVTILKGVGPTKAKQFATLNIFTLRDLICHFPQIIFVKWKPCQM